MSADDWYYVMRTTGGQVVILHSMGERDEKALRAAADREFRWYRSVEEGVMEAHRMNLKDPAEYGVYVDGALL